MSWLDNLFGAGAQRRDAMGTYEANRAILGDAQDRALEQQNLARTYALNALQGGYDTARGDLMSGQGQASGFLDRGFDAARGDLTRGFDGAINTSEDYLQRTQNVLNPYLQAGEAARNQYYNALGLNGAGSRDQFYSDLSQEVASNPIYQQGLEQQNRALARSSAATGIGGGRLAAAYARAAQERGQQYMDNRLGALERQSNLGGQFANSLAGYTNQTGQNVAGYRAAMGTALSGNEANRGTAQAQNSANFSNALANTATGYGQNQANVNMTTGNNLSNLYGQYASLNAQNRSALGNSFAATRGVGLQNVVNLAAAGLGAYRSLNRIR